MIKTWAALSAAFALAFAPALAVAGTSSTSSPASLTRTFTSSTTDTVPSWATGVFVAEQAGGGGGFSGATACGGQSGELVEQFTPVSPGATLTLTIGAGGAANAAGGNTSISGTAQPVSPAIGGIAGTSNCGSGPQYPNINGTGGPNIIQQVGFAGVTPGQYVTSGAASSVFCMLFDASTIASVSSSSAGGCSRFGKGGSPGVTASTGTGFGSGGGGGSTTGAAGAGGLEILRYVQ